MSVTSQHVRLWKYTVHPDARETFIEHYAADGTWAQLFREASGYLGTDLWCDETDKDTFYTADHWQGAQAFQAFINGFRERYEAMDAELDGLTVTETFLGAGMSIGQGFGGSADAE